MPKQVWQSEDGSIFDSEEKCLRYEKSDALFRNFYYENGVRREELPQVADLLIGLDETQGTQISARLMQMFLKEFSSLRVAISEISGFRELADRLEDMENSKGMFPDG